MLHDQVMKFGTSVTKHLVSDRVKDKELNIKGSLGITAHTDLKIPFKWPEIIKKMTKFRMSWSNYIV